jgi:hypothetical protein
MPHVDPDAFAESGSGELAYSAVADDETGVYRESRADLDERRSRKPLLAMAGGMAIFVGGVAALALALAFGIRLHVEQRPSISKKVVGPGDSGAGETCGACPAPALGSAGPGVCGTLRSARSGCPATRDPGLPAAGAVGAPRDRDHDWFHRRIGRGILVP